jgi:hypothetical protein
MMMFKRSSPDIDMLLSALLVSSIIIGGFHHFSLDADGDTKTASADTNKKFDSKADAAPVTEQTALFSSDEDTVDQIMEELETLEQSESVEEIIKVIASEQPSVNKMAQILGDILDNPDKALTRDDRIEIIVGFAALCKKTDDQYRILDFIYNKKYSNLQKGTPILYIAAHGDYPQIIPTIKAWYSKKVAKQSNRAELCEKSEYNALAHALKQKDLDALKIMAAHGVPMPKDRVSTLLNLAVRSKAGCDIIGYLLEKGADINYVVKGYTPLLHAIKNHDLAAVKKLVELGADVNKIGDNAIGNPRQMAGNALEKASKAKKKNPNEKNIKAANDAVDIEAYIIEQGAKS